MVLKALKKLKDSNRAGENKVDDSRADEDDLDEDEEDKDKMDEDEVSKIRDVLAQKSAEKWVRGISKTYMKGEHLTNNAYCQSLLNTLDKQEESICLKLSSLLKEISKHGHNGKGGEFIHIGWLLACMVADAEKVLITPRRFIKKSIRLHSKKIRRSPTSASSYMVDEVGQTWGFWDSGYHIGLTII
ncbi:hypothetical protein RhiirB3_465496 [Rhizophagus irregularis]|nr:hypothetical protein RhiirB3_465496 [Rhizophagus irregularis]